MSRCSICHTLVQQDEVTRRCDTCLQEYHDACWGELGGCATFGCAEAPPVKKVQQPAPFGGGWGDSKTCPSCGTALGSSLLVCSCGARFPYAESMTPEQYLAWKTERDAVKRIKVLLVVLFAVSMVGLPGPILGPIAGVVAYMNRERLAGAHGTYLAMGYGGAALGVTYACIFALLFLGF